MRFLLLLLSLVLQLNISGYANFIPQKNHVIETHTSPKHQLPATFHRNEEYNIDCPFKFQGQYEDSETELYYNRFRYYDCDTDGYISQDPIRLNGGELSFYRYVQDTNILVDIFGLECSRAIMNNVGTLTEKKKVDIQNILRQQGFSKTTANNGGEIWTKVGTGVNTAVVRLDPAKTRRNPRGFADEVPNTHKEIIPASEVVNRNYRPNAAITLDNFGNVSTNPRETHFPIIKQNG